MSSLPSLASLSSVTSLPYVASISSSFLTNASHVKLPITGNVYLTASSQSISNLYSFAYDGEVITFPILHNVYDNTPIIYWTLNCKTIPSSLLFGIWINNKFTLQELPISFACAYLKIIIQDVFNQWILSMKQKLIFKVINNPKYFKPNVSISFEYLNLDNRERFGYATATNLFLAKDKQFVVIPKSYFSTVLVNYLPIPTVNKYLHYDHDMVNIGWAMIDLVLLHELGHVLGLDHTENYKSVMYLYYQLNTYQYLPTDQLSLYQKLNKRNATFV